MLYPCMALVFGEAISAFFPMDTARVNAAALAFFGISIALFLSDFGAYYCFAVSAEQQMKELREQTLAHMLHMDVAWFDTHDAMQLTSRLTGDTVKIKDGMGQKLGDAIKYSAQFIGGYIIGLVMGWDITLVMICVTPFVVVTMSRLLWFFRTSALSAQKLYAEAGAVAEEALGAMRTVVSLNGEDRALNKYRERLRLVESEALRAGPMIGFLSGLFITGTWLMYGVGLWYGGYKVYHLGVEPGQVFKAFFGVLMGTQSLGQISPNLSAIAEAMGTAVALFEILDTKPEIHPSGDEDQGIVPKTCRGAIEAIDLHFTYPSRPERPILSGYTLAIESGQTVAFAGPSGGGKSTLISLLVRFYDPCSGALKLDGHDLRSLNVKWLRAQVGLVSQEPVLFAGSIYDNITAGMDGNVTQEEVEAAAKRANAHAFIMAQPLAYATRVGEKGVTLSGGQKQRVAIARALVRQPKVLVLDEATSALDNDSERVVQQALNELMRGEHSKMTTLVIAHRLSTVRHADKIVVVDGGHVAEEGTHDQLMAIEDGIYNNLYTIQELKAQREHIVEQFHQDASDGDEEEYPPPRVCSTRQSAHSVMSEANVVEESVSSEPEEIRFRRRDAVRVGKEEMRYMVLAVALAALYGLSTPLSALMTSEMIARLSEQFAIYQKSGDKNDLHPLVADVRMYALLFVAGGIFYLGSHGLQLYCFQYLKAKHTFKWRSIHFEALCRQNIAFFDQEQNGAGALSAALAVNATKVCLLSGDAQSRMSQGIFTLIAALIISFTLGSWLLTLIMLTVFPLLILGQMIWSRLVRLGAITSDELAAAGAQASEALCNIRTISSLGMEKAVCDQFSQMLEEPVRVGVKQSRMNGLAMGFSSGIIFAVYALVFWYGGVLVDKDTITFRQMIRTLMAIVMSAQGIGFAAAWLAEAHSGTMAGAAIVALQRREVPIDATNPGGLKPETVDGKIEFKNIVFRYPTRPQVTVLKKYNLTVEAGQMVAFCGPSGGGKSTVIALLERFYDPSRGQILLDGVDIRELNLRWLRARIGLVGQEPTLFIGTIAENIAYGLDKQPSQAEIEIAAKMANAHDFITQFPDGYQTQVGMKGEQLSGGQKQRIAIARAVIKNPSILLLDEATSALDSESERIVQRALDEIVAKQRRTTLVIAHRLSTIRNADKICVVNGGRIVETGTHKELLGQGGLYAQLAACTK